MRQYNASSFWSPSVEFESMTYYLVLQKLLCTAQVGWSHVAYKTVLYIQEYSSVNYRRVQHLSSLRALIYMYVNYLSCHTGLKKLKRLFTY